MPPLVADLEQLLDQHPEVIVEGSGHDALRQYGPRILQAGCDLLTLSVGALANAANTPERARTILTRAREALSLPDVRYPKESLMGLIARLLHRWPELRGPGEQPTVFERAA